MSKRFCVLLFLSVAVFFIAIFLLDRLATVSVTTADRFYLPQSKIRELTDRVRVHNDARAAVRLALYYERTVGDLQTFIKWEKNAALLGDIPSQKWLAENAELVESIEAGEKWHAENQTGRAKGK